MAQNKINKTGENMNKNNIETFKVDYSGTCAEGGGGACAQPCDPLPDCPECGPGTATGGTATDCNFSGCWTANTFCGCSDGEGSTADECNTCNGPGLGSYPGCNATYFPCWNGECVCDENSDCPTMDQYC